MESHLESTLVEKKAVGRLQAAGSQELTHAHSDADLTEGLDGIPAALPQFHRITVDEYPTVDPDQR